MPRKIKHINLFIITLILFTVLAFDLPYVFNNTIPTDNYIISDYIRAKLILITFHDVFGTAEDNSLFTICNINAWVVRNDFWFNHINTMLESKPLTSILIAIWHLISGVQLDVIMLIPISKICIVIIFISMFSRLIKRSLIGNVGIAMIFLLPMLSLTTLISSSLYYRSLGYLFLYLYYLLFILIEKVSYKELFIFLLLFVAMDLTYYSVTYMSLFSIFVVSLLAYIFRFNLLKKNLINLFLVNSMIVFLLDTVYPYIIQKSNITNLLSSIQRYVIKLKITFLQQDTNNLSSVAIVGLSSYTRIMYLIDMVYKLLSMTLFILILVNLYSNLRKSKKSLIQFIVENTKLSFIVLMFFLSGLIKSIGYVSLGHMSSLLANVYVFFIPITISLLTYTLMYNFRQKVRLKNILKVVILLLIILHITNKILYYNDPINPVSIRNRIELIEESNRLPLTIINRKIVLSSHTCSAILSYKLASIVGNAEVSNQLLPHGNISSVLSEYKYSNIMIFVPLLYKHVSFDKSGWELLPPLDYELIKALKKNNILLDYGSSILISPADKD